MHIRPAESIDVEPITAIENRAIRESIAHFGTAELSEARMHDRWLRARDRYPWLVAVSDAAESEREPTPASGTFMGYARAAPWKPREAYDWTAEITVYVEPRFQRRGVGRALYARLFDELAGLGFRTLLAGITLPNEASVRLHEAMGMGHVGTLPNVGYKFDRWLSVGYWALDLRAR